MIKKVQAGQPVKANEKPAQVAKTEEKEQKKKTYDTLSFANNKVAEWLDSFVPKADETAEHFKFRLKANFLADFKTHGGMDLSAEAEACIFLLLDNSSPDSLANGSFKEEPRKTIDEVTGAEIGVDATYYRNNMNRCVGRDDKGDYIVGKDGKFVVDMEQCKFLSAVRKYQTQKGLTEKQLKEYFPIVRVVRNARGKLVDAS